MISIIGSGRVGSATAFLCTSNSLDDIVLVNRTRSKAIGEYLDLANTIPEDSSISISGTDDYSEIKDSDVVVIAASTAVYQKSRTEMMSNQVKMIRDIAKKITKYCPQATILVVSNPVDVLTYFFLKESGFNKKQVLGVASTLDSSRFRFLIAKELGLKQSEISNTYVFGEHGDSMVPVFSKIKVNGNPIQNLLNQNQIQKITNDLKNYWKTLREYKSRSVFGISKNCYDLIKLIKEGEKNSTIASVLLTGEYGISDVCLGVPVEISNGKINQIIELKFTDYELDLLHKSALVIKNYIKNY